MRSSIWIGIASTATVATIVSPSPAWGKISNSGLIAEIESLRNSLRLNDPSRPAMTLRLADLLFNEVNELGKKTELNSQQSQKILQLRRKAVALYQEALNGTSYQPSASGLLRVKVLFQVGRLKADQGEAQEALKIWEELASQKRDLKIQREAVLRLAEYYESQPNQLQQAENFYQKAMDLCQAGDPCYYAHYRMAWVHYRRGAIDQGISELKSSLWDSKGQVREEVLRDLLLFWSQKANADGTLALEVFEPLAEKLSRPELLQKLSDAFFAAGNKKAGVDVLRVVNARQPQFATQVRLLEESYGLRDWEFYQQVFDQIPPAPSARVGKGTQVEEKILRRLTVQLDGERVSDPARLSDFQNAVDLYLAYFPESSHRVQMQEGWLTASTNSQQKLQRLQKWIAEEKDQKQKIIFRKARAGIAQKEKLHLIVAEEMGALSRLKTPEQREYAYAEARALYEAGKNQKAIELFSELAGDGKNPDRWALQAENLVLDILNQQQKYDELVRRARAWIPQARANQRSLQPLLPQLDKELSDLEKIATQAEFEAASLRGKTPQALETFRQFCLSGQFSPKSCVNARVLAEELKNTPVLFEILRKMGKEEELAVEYEAAGFFARSAELLEKQKTGSELRPQLKIALLYELDGRMADRDRVLSALFKQVARPSRWKKLTPQEEDLLLETFDDAKMLSPQLLKVGMRLQNQQWLAHRLEKEGKGNRHTRTLLLNSDRPLGEIWRERVLEKLRGLKAKQSRIGFYGRGSKWKFNKRIKSLNAYVQEAERFLQFADPQTRIEIATDLSHAYTELRDALLATPLPADLPPETQEQVLQQLQSLATPFGEKAQTYQSIAKDQQSKLLQVQQEGEKQAQSIASQLLKAEVRAQAMSALQENPSDQKAVEKLARYYEGRSQSRLALYFRGRLEQMKAKGEL